jgi:hypothetical protein
MVPLENVYEKYCDRFEATYPEDHDWINVHDGEKLKDDAIASLINSYFSSEELIVLIHKDEGVGVKLPRSEIYSYIAQHIFEAEIQVSNIEFISCVAISITGVATGWKMKSRINKII